MDELKKAKIRYRAYKIRRRKQQDRSSPLEVIDSEKYVGTLDNGRRLYQTSYWPYIVSSW